MKWFSTNDDWLIGWDWKGPKCGFNHPHFRVRRMMSVGTCAWSRKPCDLALWGKETMPDAFFGGTIPGYLGKTVNLAKTQKCATKTGKDRLMNFTMSSFFKKPLLDLQTQQVWQSFPQFSR